MDTSRSSMPLLVHDEKRHLFAERPFDVACKGESPAIWCIQNEVLLVHDVGFLHVVGIDVGRKKVGEAPAEAVHEDALNRNGVVVNRNNLIYPGKL